MQIKEYFIKMSAKGKATQFKSNIFCSELELIKNQH